jgi:RNA polymerase sigma-70 factor (ECF subfamily)
MNLNPPDDADLMRAFALGNERAFAVLVDRHGRDIKAYAVRMLRNAELAEDVFVETFTRVAAHKGRWEARGSVRGWLFTIAHRLCIDMLRDRQRALANQSKIIELEVGRQVQPSPEAEAMLQQLAAELEKAIARLPEAHRQVLLLRVMHGLSSEETAQIVGLDEEQVRSQLSYARKQIRLHLAGFEETASRAVRVRP